MKGNRRDEITFVEARATSERALGQTDASGGDRGGDAGAGSAADPARAIRELGPLLPAVATEVLPELVRRLNSRVAARTIREVFAEEGAVPAPAASR